MNNLEIDINILVNKINDIKYKEHNNKIIADRNKLIKAEKLPTVKNQFTLEEQNYIDNLTNKTKLNLINSLNQKSIKFNNIYVIVL